MDGGAEKNCSCAENDGDIMFVAIEKYSKHPQPKRNLS